jgi:hypothetical protein
LATLDWDQFARRVNEVHRVVEAHSMDKAAMAVPLVMNAWYHAGAADVALELITNVEDLDRRRALTELFTAPPDLLDWTAFSLGTRSVISALDLCAAAVWRLSDGQPLGGGKEQDLDGAFLKWAQLTSGPLVDWLVRVHESAEYPAIREFRHGFTHRLVSRHVKVLLGQPTRSEFESEVGNFRQTAIAHLHMAVPSPSSSSQPSATQPSTSTSKTGRPGVPFPGLALWPAVSSLAARSMASPPRMHLPSALSCAHPPGANGGRGPGGAVDG